VLLHALDRLYVLPSLLVALAAAVYLGVQVVRLCRGRLDPAGVAGLVLAVCVAVYMAGMHVVFFRAKEAYLVTPQAMMLFVAAICIAVEGICGRLRPLALGTVSEYPCSTA
jgi:uncharacterized membrane protein YedE/YeeE